MSITDELFAKSNLIISKQAEVRDEGKGYSMADDGGVELEVGEFLYGLIRLIKPDNILETGTYTGISSMYMGQGLKDNGFGKLTTLEYEQFHIDRAERLWKNVGVQDFVRAIRTSSLDFRPENKYDLLFLDTEPAIRFQELLKFYPFLNEGGFIGIHDCPRTMCQGNINPDHPEIASYPFGDIPAEMNELIKSGQLVKFHFPNPRGLVFFYKPAKDDYKC